METCPEGERVNENSLKRSRSRLIELCGPGAGVAPGSVRGSDMKGQTWKANKSDAAPLQHE